MRVIIITAAAAAVRLHLDSLAQLSGEEGG